MSRLVTFLAGMCVGAACVGVWLLARPLKPAGDLAACEAVQPVRMASSTSHNCDVPAAAPVSVPPAVAAAAAPAPPAASHIATEVSAPEPAAVPEPMPQPGMLLIPVQGIRASQLADTFTDSRSGGRVHDAIDIMAPRGTPVLAAADGKVVKLFHSVQGGTTLYQFDADQVFAYYYAHLDGYAEGITEGMLLKRGDPIGQVGFSGNASAAAPHLHFAIFRLGPEKRWWEGTAINPYPLLGGK